MSPYWENPPIFDKPQPSSLAGDKFKQSPRPMRGLKSSHVTSFRPITRLYFRNLKIIRGTLYKIFMGFFIGICHIWGVSPYWQILGFVILGLFATLPEWKEDLPIYHSGRVANNFLIKLMTNPTWVLPIMGNVPILRKPTHIWQTPTLLTSWRKIQAISSTNERAQK